MKKYKCTECGEIFTSKQWDEHTKKEMYDTDFYRQLHTKIENGVNKSSFKCPNCNEIVKLVTSGSVYEV